VKKITIIGTGAIATYVAERLRLEAGIDIGSVIVGQGSQQRARGVFGDGVEIVHAVGELSARPDLALDCAGHGALRQHGETILADGIDLASVSSGALADDELYRRLREAARRGGAQLRIVSGAIGALDALSAASVGGLTGVIYRGRKPPQGWLGSPAEQVLDLENLTAASTHFTGTARQAALDYPKNAHVAASVALAGLGFDETEVELIADPGISRNIHEVVAEGEFGSLQFRIVGMALPGNPRSSAITAMSVVRDLLNRVSPVVV
jgi:aspartate dehydrogenase